MTIAAWLHSYDMAPRDVAGTIVIAALVYQAGLRLIRLIMGD